MRQPTFFGIMVSAIVLLLFAQDLLVLGKRNKERHNRDANNERNGEKDKGKGRDKPQQCVSDYCLPHDYNALDLPSSERQDVQINLEVSVLTCHGSARS